MDDDNDDIMVGLLDCGYKDLDVLDNYLGKAECWGVNIDIRDVIDEVRQNFGKVDFNSLLYEIMKQIVINLAGDLGDEAVEKAEEKFEPYLNYMDSWFNMGLDDLDSENTREEAVKEVKEWLEIKEVKNG